MRVMPMYLAENLKSSEVAVTSQLSFMIQKVNPCDIGKINQNIWIGLSKTSEHQMKSST